MSKEYIQKVGLLAASTQLKTCCCIGPQNGEPRCPCEMKNVIIRNGRWIQPEVDLGPISPATATKENFLKSDIFDGVEFTEFPGERGVA